MGSLVPCFCPPSIAPSVLPQKMSDATPLLSCNPESVISPSHDRFFSFFLIAAFHVQLFYLVCFGKQHDWMVFLLKAMRGLTTDTSPVTSMWFFSFMPWHSKRAAWSDFRVPSPKPTRTMLENDLLGVLCLHHFHIFFLNFVSFSYFSNWNKWIQNSTVHKIQWHQVKYSRALVMINSVSFLSCHSSSSSSYHEHNLKTQRRALNLMLSISNMCTFICFWKFI